MIVDDLMKEVERLLVYTPPRTPCYFARDFELKDAIEALKDINVYVCDYHGHVWYRGEKIK